MLPQTTYSELSDIVCNQNRLPRSAKSQKALTRSKPTADSTLVLLYDCMKISHKLHQKKEKGSEVVRNLNTASHNHKIFS